MVNYDCISENGVSRVLLAVSNSFIKIANQVTAENLWITSLENPNTLPRFANTA